MSGRFKLKELHSDLTLVIQVDDDNRKLFEEFEEKLSAITNYQLRWIKKDNVYLKIYNKPNGKMNLKFWQLFERDGKEYRKPLHNPDNLIEKNSEGEVIFKFDKIFNGKINERKYSLKSIISVAEEIIVREILEEHSCFEKNILFWRKAKMMKTVIGLMSIHLLLGKDIVVVSEALLKIWIKRKNYARTSSIILRVM